MPRTYCVTYDIVTPESAEDGDVSERGFCDLGTRSRQIPMPPDLRGDAVKPWRAQFDFDVEVTPDNWPDYIPAPNGWPVRVAASKESDYGFAIKPGQTDWKYGAYTLTHLCIDGFGNRIAVYTPDPNSDGSSFPRRSWSAASDIIPNGRLLGGPGARIVTDNDAAGMDPYIPDSEACVRAMARILLDAGATETSGSPHSTGNWYTALDADQDFRTGETTSYSYHLDGWTPQEERLIAALVKARNANAVLLP